VTVVVTPSARETFTPRELSAAYEDYTEHGPQYMNAQTGLLRPQSTGWVHACSSFARSPSRE
jgi:hypothetical protein